jgi:hypothetical protein
MDCIILSCSVTNLLKNNILNRLFKLTPWCRVTLDKFMFTQHSKKSAIFKELKGWLQCSHKSYAGSYPILGAVVLYPHLTSCPFKNHCHLGFTQKLSPCFPTKMVYTRLISTVLTTNFLYSKTIRKWVTWILPYGILLHLIMTKIIRSCKWK